MWKTPPRASSALAGEWRCGWLEIESEHGLLEEALEEGLHPEARPPIGTYIYDHPEYEQPR
jgi:hypothetical protein